MAARAISGRTARWTPRTRRRGFPGVTFTVRPPRSLPRPRLPRRPGGSLAARRATGRGSAGPRRNVTVEEAVDKAARESAAVLAERGRHGFYGEVALKYAADEIVTVEIKETVRKA